MNSFLRNRTKVPVAIFAVAAISACLIQGKPDNKVTPTDVITKHLASIGSVEARASIHGMRIKGTCDLAVKLGGIGQSKGRVMLASQGSRNLVNMTFDSGEPSTGFAYDGSRTTVTQFRPGRHTPLEQFFSEYEGIVKEGLFGGTLSESWSLLDLQERHPKLEYTGVKKIDGKQLHAIRYTPRKGSELKITLFFDVETFRHVRTEYEQTVYSTEQKRIPGGAGGLPTIDNTRGAAQRLNAYEEFSDFKPEGGLNLPHTYKFELSVQSQTRPMLVDWIFNLTDFTFNAPLNASEFTVGKGTTKEK